MVNLVKPNYFLTFFVTTTPSVVEEKIFKLCSETQTPLLFSGNPLNSPIKDNDLLIYLENPTDLIALLEEELSTT
jgi:hypothetical protein